MKRLLGLCALLSFLAGCASNDTVDPHGYDKTGVASYYGAKHQGNAPPVASVSTRIP